MVAGQTPLLATYVIEALGGDEVQESIGLVCVCACMCVLCVCVCVCGLSPHGALDTHTREERRCAQRTHLLLEELHDLCVGLHGDVLQRRQRLKVKLPRSITCNEAAAAAGKGREEAREKDKGEKAGRPP